VAASAIDHDLISPNRTAADAAAVKRTRLWVVVVSLASASAALSPLAGDIMSLTSLSGSFYAACFLPALVVGLFLKRVSVQAALASMILGIITVLCWYVARRLQMVSLHEIYPGLAEGLAVYLLVTLLLGDKMKEAGSGS